MARKTMNHKRHRSEQKSRRERRAERTRGHQTLATVIRAARRKAAEMSAEQSALAR